MIVRRTRCEADCLAGFGLEEDSEEGEDSDFREDSVVFFNIIYY
jgi:hypothetical protein